MALSRDRFMLGRRRLRQVLDYLEAHLDEEHISLGSLAEVANLSRYHFERMYVQNVGEAPMATIRRLRLIRARDSLLHGRVRSITDLALASGYGSVAAFSRAFSRAFALPPSEIRPAPERVAPPPMLELVELATVPIWRLPYSGPASEVFAAGEEFSWLIARGGGRRWRHWTVHPEGWVDPQRNPDSWVRMWHCVPCVGQPPDVPGVERGFLPGGRYARFSLMGQRSVDLAPLLARIPHETGCRPVDGPVIRYFPHVLHHRAPSERCIQFHLSVAPAGR